MTPSVAAPSVTPASSPPPATPDPATPDPATPGPDAGPDGEPTTSLAVAVRRSNELEQRIAAHPEKFRILTGDRPTGPLHLGHYLGTLANRVRLQRAGVELFVVIADYQVITDRDRPGDVRRNVRELLLDYLAAGIAPRLGTGARPETATIFAHSAVPELNQLLLPFLSLVSVAELRRNPTVKAEAAAAGLRSMSGLMLTYPVHQAADILFCGADLVPVGKDQLPHLETTRLVARRFNDRYGGGRPVLTEPDALLSTVPLLLGTDGRKMSKSAGNAIALGDDEDETARRIRSALTDSERTITYEPERRPEVANLLLAAAMCQGRDPREVADEIGDGGAAMLKRVVTESVNEHLRPLRLRRQELADADDHLQEVLKAGAAHAREIAAVTLARVRAAMGMTY